MVVLFFELLCFASCAFLIYVFVQFRRQEKRSRAVLRPRSQERRPQLRLVKLLRRPASLSESTKRLPGEGGISGAAVALLVTRPDMNRARLREPFACHPHIILSWSEFRTDARLT